MENSLFPLPEAEKKEEQAGKYGRPRLKLAQREQVEWRMMCLDSLLPEDHRARMVWTWVERMDISPLYAEIKAVEGQPGQSTIDPCILVGLWLLATLDGVGSARLLDRMCKESVAYQWICGGVTVNYHTLSDFRVQHGEVLDQILVESVAALYKEGLVTMVGVAQDGKKIRASAGSSSFHREETLDKYLAEAKEQVETLRKELENDAGVSNRRQQAARQRAASERVTRVEHAQRELEAKKAQAHKTGRDKIDAKDKKKEPRASSTDPEARVMKMADGGFRPAVNAQFCTDEDSNIIVGLAVEQQGNDTGLASPMLDQIEENYQVRPQRILTDTSYSSLNEVTTITQSGTVPYMAIPIKGNQDEEQVYLPKTSDTPEVAAWRTRMGSDEGKAILAKRGQVAELVHAVLDQMNLARVRVRGREKIRAVLLWFILVHNFLREQLLRKKLSQSASA